MRKGQSYILDSDGKITFVVLIIVTKKPRDNMAVARSLLEEDDSLSQDRHIVHVHVFKAKRLPGGNLTGERLVDRVQIFPGPAPEDTFTITWADINCGTWANFRDAVRLLPDTPQPACEVNFSTLASIAMGLAGQARDDPDEGSPLYRAEDVSDAMTPATHKTRFLASSSPAIRLSSVPSDQERGLDPDYEPSVESGASCGCSPSG